MKIGFVRSRKPYSSYEDFWKLVGLCGFETAWADEADLAESGRLWVWPTMNMEFLGRILTAGKRRKAKVAWWYLERPDAQIQPIGDPILAFRGAVAEALRSLDAVWVSDRALAKLAPGSRYAAFGSHHGLAEVARLTIRYDIAFFGQRTPRRAAAIAAIEARGLSVTPECSGFDRASALASSKIALVVGRVDGMPVLTPLRWAVAAAYSLAILQEDLPDPWPLVAGVSVRMSPLDAIPLAATELAGGDAWIRFGRAARDALCRETTFKDGVERAARELE